MSNPKPAVQEEQRKLHGEITQALNQRFLTTTTALALFGVVAGLIVQEAESERMVLLLSGLLNAGLFLIYLQSHLLRRVTRSLATYLVLRGWSEYEKDLEDYRRYQFRSKSYLAYTKAQALIFLALGAVSAALPYLISLSSGKDLQHPLAAVLVGLCGLLFLVFIAGMGLNDWFVNLEEMEEKWRQVLRKNGRIE